MPNMAIYYPSRVKVVIEHDDKFWTEVTEFVGLSLGSLEIESDQGGDREFVFSTYGYPKVKTVRVPKPVKPELDMPQMGEFYD